MENVNVHDTSNPRIPLKCKLCEDILSKKGHRKHYFDQHQLSIVDFDGDYEFAIPLSEDGKYHCPTCPNARRDMPNLRAHVVQCAAAARHCDQCKQDVANGWLHDELYHVHTCKVTYKNNVTKILRREHQEDGYVFKCEGCDFSSPFPGTMKFHVMGCRLVSEAGAAALAIEENRPRLKFPAFKKRMSDSVQADTPTSKRRLTIDRFVASPRLSVVLPLSSRHAGGDGDAGPSNKPTEPASLSASASSQVKSATGTAKTLPSTISLSGCTFSPGLPDIDIHAFVHTLPAPSESALHIFHCLGLAGIQSKRDLTTLSQCIQDDNDEARTLLLTKGLNFMEWFMVQNHIPGHHITQEERKSQKEGVLTFLTGCKPPLDHRAPIFQDVGLRYSDIELLATLPNQWSPVATYLLAKGFTFPEFLSFKRGLRSLTNEPGGSSSGAATPAAPHALTSFVANLQGPVVEKLGNFTRIGLETGDEFDVLCTLPEEQIDEVLEMLSKEGLTWSECKAVDTGLKMRAGALRS